MSEYFLGVDGGQSSTFALIGDEHGRVIGAGRAGPCNHVSGPEKVAKFRAALQTVVAEAARAAGVRDLRFKSAFLGLSGGTEDKESLVREIIAAEHVEVVNDAEIALSGAFGGAPGIIVIAGTGSIACGRNAAGRRARAGGWGFIYGDEGSAFDITRQALRAALRFEEGWGPSTTLKAMLVEATGTKDADQLMHHFYTGEFPRRVIAGFARLVDQAARAGDKIADKILNEAAHQLAIIANAVAFTLFQNDPVRVAYIGGVFSSKIVLERFRAILELEGSEVLAPKHGPAAGALIEAYRLVGMPVELAEAPAEKL